MLQIHIILPLAGCKDEEFRRGSSALADAQGAEREEVARWEIDGERERKSSSFPLLVPSCVLLLHTAGGRIFIPLIHSGAAGRRGTLIANGSSIKLPLRKGNGIRRTLAYTRLFLYMLFSGRGIFISFWVPLSLLFLNDTFQFNSHRMGLIFTEEHTFAFAQA